MPLNGYYRDSPNADSGPMRPYVSDAKLPFTDSSGLRPCTSQRTSRGPNYQTKRRKTDCDSSHNPIIEDRRTFP